MVQDRGGLQYTIAIRDQFSKAIEDFKKGLKSAKAEFKAFSQVKKDSGEATNAIKKNTKAIDENRAALKKLDADSKAQAKRERDLNRVRASLRADERRQIALTAAAQRRASQESANALRAEQRRIKAVFDARNRAEREAAKISAALRRDQARDLLNQQRQIQATIQARSRAEREAARISAAQRRDVAANQALDPDFQANRRNLDALREEAIIRAQIGQLRARAAQQARGGDLLGASQSLRQVKELEASVARVDRSARNLFFTFRRLVGILAVFTIARNTVTGFQQLVAAGLKFNDNIIEATVSIAGLIAATGDVRDEFGKSVDSSKELALSQSIARKQVELLRQDALRTTATFEQLAQTFQVAVAPGFTAGLNIDEIRKLTVGISQAAAAIGLEQNQLAEEVRSLLSGTIQTRTTRIATALGITNEDVRRLKESGQLFDFLETKLKAFDEAAQQVARSTLGGISNLVKGAFSKILGDAAGPLFQNLLKLGNELFDKVLTVRDAAGDIQPNPEVIKAFQQIFDTLSNGVDSLRTLGKDLGFKGLQDIFKGLGAGLTASIELAIGFSETLLVSLKAVVVVVQSIADAFGLTTKQLGQVAGPLGTALAVSVVWKNTLGLIGLGFGNIAGIVRSLIPSLDALLSRISAAGGFARVIGTNLRTSAIGALGLAAAVGVALKGVELIAQAILGIDLNLKDTIQLIALGVLGSLVQALGFFQKLGNQIINFFKEGFQSLADGAETAIISAKRLAAAIVGNQKAVEDLTGQKEAALVEQENAKRIRDAQFQVELKDQETQLAAKLLGIQREIADVAGARAGANAQGSGFDPSFDLDKFLKTAEAVRDGKNATQEFVPIISTAANKVRELEEAFAGLQTELRKTGIELAAALQNGGLEGVGAQISGVFTDADVKLGEDLLDVQAALKTNAEDINAANARGNARYHERLELGVDTGRQDAESIKLRTQLADIAAKDKQDQALVSSLIADRNQLLEAQIDLEKTSTALSVRKAALIAAQTTPGVNRENIGAAAEVAAQRTLLGLQRLRVDARKAAVVEAQVEIDLLKTELALSQQQQRATIEEVRSKAALASGNELTALNDLLTALQVKLQLEEASNQAKLEGLRLTQEEAALVADGSLTQGVQRGFEDLAKTLPTAFQAGIALVRDITQQTADFISSAIISAFDPTDDSSLTERIGRFLQGIAQTILQTLVEQGIASAVTALTTQTVTATTEITGATTAAGIREASAVALTTASTLEVTNATTAAAIRAASSVAAASRGGFVKGFAKGGHVMPSLEHMSGRAQGLARGGRPSRIPASDTIPAWLTPGEFVMSKRTVDKMGVNFFRAINQGDFNVPMVKSPAATHALAAGMASGGTVGSSQAISASRSSGGRGGSDDNFQILPVQVAGERELNRQMAGGQAAFMRFIRDNASTVKGIINKGG